MHPSAFAHMTMCVDTYLDRSKHYRIVDVGSRISAKQQMTHRDLFADYSTEIVGVDIADGRNVDRVMTRPYRIPVRSNSADLVISGQAFEHIPFFWATFLDMCRVVKPGGLIFLSAPSRGHVHTVQDCWRYYPDGMRALAAFSRVKLREAHTDFPPRVPGRKEHDYDAIETPDYYWGDTVGVFQKPLHPSKLVVAVRIPILWWANRVGGLDPVPKPKRRPERTRVLERYRAADWKS